MKFQFLSLFSLLCVFSHGQDYSAYGFSQKFARNHRVKKVFIHGFYTWDNRKEFFKWYETYDTAGRILTYKNILKNKSEQEVCFFYHGNLLDSVTVYNLEFDSVQYSSSDEWEIKERSYFKEFKYRYSNDTTFTLVNKGCLCFCKDDENPMDTAAVHVNKRNAKGTIYEQLMIDYGFGKRTNYSEYCYNDTGRVTVWNYYYKSETIGGEAEYTDSAHISIQTVKYTNLNGDNVRRVTYNYRNKKGLITQTIHPDGEKTTIRYNTQGLEVESKKSKEGLVLAHRKTRYAYRLP